MSWLKWSPIIAKIKKESPCFKTKQRLDSSSFCFLPFALGALLPFVLCYCLLNAKYFLWVLEGLGEACKVYLIRKHISTLHRTFNYITSNHKFALTLDSLFFLEQVSDSIYQRYTFWHLWIPSLSDKMSICSITDNDNKKQ